MCRNLVGLPKRSPPGQKRLARQIEKALTAEILGRMTASDPHPPGELTIGYHAGGLWLHDPVAAIDRLCDLGFRAVAIRSRRGFLNPGEPDFATQWRAVTDVIRCRDCRLVIDGDAAYVFDEHSPRLPSLAGDDSVAGTGSANGAAGASWTIDWIRRWIDAAGELPGTILTLGSGASPGCSGDGGGPAASGHATETALERLASRMGPLVDAGHDAGVDVALCPSAGTCVESVAAFERFLQWFPGRSGGGELGLAADTREMIGGGEWPLGARLQRNRRHLKCVYLADVPISVDGVGVGQSHDGIAWRGQPAALRRDAWLGKGEMAVERFVRSLGEMPLGGPLIVRAEGHAAAGLQPAVAAATLLGLTPRRGH